MLVYINRDNGEIVAHFRRPQTEGQETIDDQDQEFLDYLNKVTWDDVEALQRSMIVMHNDMMQIHEREVAHDGTVEADYTITPAKYQEYLSYFQVIRQNDEELHAEPADAIAALEALTPPSLT